MMSKEDMRIMYQCYDRFKTTCNKDCLWEYCPAKDGEENEI